MKEWWKKFCKRIGDLVNEVVAVKTVAMVVISFAYFPQMSTLGLFGFLVFAFLWLAFIGIRYAEKRLYILKELKEIVK